VANLEYLLGQHDVSPRRAEGAAPYTAQFESAMDDDFNTADAITAIFDLVKFVNTKVDENTDPETLQAFKTQIISLCDICGLLVEKAPEILEAEIEALIAERQNARKEKDFARADAIRAELLSNGIVLEDTREGVKWHKKN
jgi:cysteinyl-tRNA synthetase